jgi:hypothetical protein
MNAHGEERRKYRRVFFRKEDAISASFTFPEIQEESVDAGVMNLSEEGICLTYRKDPAIKIKKDDVLTLTQLKGLALELEFDELKIAVRWVMKDDFFEHEQIGCEILNTPSSLKEQIRQIEPPA